MCAWEALATQRGCAASELAVEFQDFSIHQAVSVQPRASVTLSVTLSATDSFQVRLHWALLAVCMGQQPLLLAAGLQKRHANIAASLTDGHAGFCKGHPTHSLIGLRTLNHQILNPNTGARCCPTAT